MSYFYIGAGIIMIIGALYSMLKQSTTFHQGAFPIPVDKAKYTRFTGIVDLVCGVVLLLLGILHFPNNVELLICFALLAITIVSSIFAGNKYRL